MCTFYSTLTCSSLFRWEVSVVSVVVVCTFYSTLTCTSLFRWEVSVVSVGVVCTFYSTLGGMKAVLMTDLFQVSKCLMF